MLATSMNEAGYSVEYFALLMLIILSSNGWRITSKTERLNSGSSSKRKKWYHCNSLIANHKAPKMTTIYTIKLFTTTKLVSILAKAKNYDNICSCSLAEVRQPMEAGFTSKELSLFPSKNPSIFLIFNQLNFIELALSMLNTI
jgi:hypothetical protein